MDTPLPQREPLDSQMQQRLRELAEGRLPNRESVELHRRIASDGRLALAYAEVRRQVEFAKPAGPESLRTTAVHATGDAPIGRGPRPQTGDRQSWARWSNWIVGLTASFLLLVSTGGYFYHRGRLFGLASEHLRLRVTGPSQLQLGVRNRYSIAATSITGRGLPAPVELTLRSLDGKSIFSHQERPDAQGRVDVVLSHDLNLPAEVRLEVVATHRERTEQFSTVVPTRPPRRIAHVVTDRTEYRSGDVVQARLAVLPWLSSTALAPSPVRYELRDPQGGVVSGTLGEVAPDAGLASLRMTLPSNALPGTYALVVRSATPGFTELQHPVSIAGPAAPPWNMRLEFLREGLSPGDKAVAFYSVLGADGRTPSDVRVEMCALFDGRVVHQAKSRPDALGAGRVEFTVPAGTPPASAFVLLTAAQGERTKSIARRIPLQTGRVRVRFFPEGGNLVAGLENRIYFTSNDALGRPMPLQGEVLNSRGLVVAYAESDRTGRGCFAMLPAPGESYRLRVRTPADAAEELRLPDAVTTPAVVLTAGNGIIEPGKPLEFNVRVGEGVRIPLIAVASSRGIQVGQGAFIPEEGANAVSIPVEPNVEGVLRLTLYDYRESPPKVLASRRLFRRPATPLRVEATSDATQYAFGDRARLQLRVTNASGEPAPAALAVWAASAGERPTSGPCFPSLAASLLLGELSNSPAMHTAADATISNTPEAAASLESLLGTCDERPSPLAPGERREETPSAASVSPEETVAAPLMLDNLTDLSRRFEDSVSIYRNRQTRILNTVVTISFFGGAALLLFILMLAILNIPCYFRVRGPAVPAAGLSIFVGVVLMSPARTKGGLQGNLPFAVHDGRGEPAPVINVKTPATPRMFSLEGRHDLERSARSYEDEAAGLAATPPASLLWEPNLAAERRELTLALPDSPTTIAFCADACDATGRFGSTVLTMPVRSPLRIDSQPPENVSVGDRIDGPIHLTNATPRKRTAEIALETSGGLRIHGPKSYRDELAAGGKRTRFVSLNAEPGEPRGQVAIRSVPDRDAAPVVRTVRVASLGYPHSSAFNGRIAQRASIPLITPGNLVPGSLRISLQLDPTIAARCRRAAESLDRNALASVEQSFAIVQLDAMCLADLLHRESTDPLFLLAAKESTTKHTRRIVAWESPTKGFDWFGGPSGREALTAFGLLTFRDSAELRPIDHPLVLRSAQWLVGRWNPKPNGGSKSPVRPVVPAPIAPAPVVAAYVAWAVGGGVSELPSLLQPLLADASTSNDPYLIAAAASAAFAANNRREGRDLLARLATHQQPDGSLPGPASTALAATGNSARVETVALAALAWMQNAEYTAQADRAVRWLQTERRADGTFGTPAATASALRALSEHDDGRRRSFGAGRLIVRRNETVLAERLLTGRETAPIDIEGLERDLRPGPHTLTLERTGEGELPYTVVLSYRLPTPDDSPAPPLRLRTQLAETKLKMGQTVALSAELENTSDRPAAMTVAVLRLPAGLEPRRDELDALRNAGRLDFFEIRPTEVYLVRRELPAGQKVAWTLHLAAQTPGRFTSQPMCVYANGDPESRRWTEPLAVEIAAE